MARLPGWQLGGDPVEEEAEPEVELLVARGAGRPREPARQERVPAAGGRQVVDNNLPSIAASTTGGPVFGNLNNAMVRREVRYPSVMRLQERYADQLAVGYIGFHRIDYRSNDMRAAVTVKPAAT